MPLLNDAPRSFFGSFGLAILAVFAPPVAVALRRGCSMAVVVSVGMLLLLWIPAVIHAIIICFPSTEPPPLEMDELDIQDAAHARRLERRQLATTVPIEQPGTRAPSAIDPPASLAPPPPPPPLSPNEDQHLRTTASPTYFGPALPAPASNTPGTATSDGQSQSAAQPWRSNFPPTKDRPAPASASASATDWKSNFPPSKERPAPQPTPQPAPQPASTALADWRSNFPQSKERPVHTTSAATARGYGANALGDGSTGPAPDVPRSELLAGQAQAGRETPSARYLHPPPLPPSASHGPGAPTGSPTPRLVLHDPAPAHPATSASASDLSRASHFTHMSRTSRTSRTSGPEISALPRPSPGGFRVVNPSAGDGDSD